MWPTLAETLRPHVAIYVRRALAAGFLTSVSDRLGLWGPSGTANVAWGTFQRFAAYTDQLNPWRARPRRGALVSMEPRRPARMPSERRGEAFRRKKTAA
jgi:hypothetical protein